MIIKVFALNTTVPVNFMINNKEDGSAPTVRDLMSHTSLLDWFGHLSPDQVTNELDKIKFPGDDEALEIDTSAALKMVLRQALEEGTEVWISLPADDVQEEQAAEATPDGQPDLSAFAPTPDGQSGEVIVEMFGGLVNDVHIQIISGVTKLGDDVIMSALRAHTRFSPDQIAHCVITVNGENVEHIRRADYVLHDGDSIGLSSRKSQTKGC